MVKNYILLTLLFFAIYGVRGQNYFAVRNDGDLPKGYILDKIYEADKSVLLTQPSNDLLSETMNIPFDFYFYGKSVRSYKASDNGYITFDVSQVNSLEPGISLPANSIVGFWKDFKLQGLPFPNVNIGVQVFAYTMGQAPNRRHVIQFYGLSLASDPLDKPVTNKSIYAFAIILYEGNAGRFDVTFSPYGDPDQKGAIGCSNEDKSSERLLSDSLVNMPFQFSFETNNFIVYQFIQGQQPDYDLVIKSMELGKIYPVNSIVNFSGKLSNWGKKTVNSFYLNYSINAGDTISYLIDGLTLLPNGDGTINFQHPISWLSGAAGSLNDVNFWISDPNGMSDEIFANSHIYRKILRNLNNSPVARNVLFEEATGAWCGYCPDAHLILEKAVEQFGRLVIPVSYHIEDSMSTTEGDKILSAYVTSYPDALLDRKVFLGSGGTWLSEAASRLNVAAPVEILIEQKSFNHETREVKFRIKARFTDYWYGNLRLGSIVTENKVRGNPLRNIWSQYNYYSKAHSGGKGGPDHPLYNENEYMDGYFHQSVVRGMPGGAWGVEGLMPALVSPGQEFFQDFTYLLPLPTYVSYETDNNTPYCSTIDLPGQNEGWNIPANINLIGFVSEYDESDVTNRPVINAGQVPLWDFANNLKDARNSGSGPLVYPNPANDLASVRLDLETDSDVNISVCNQLGQVVFTEVYKGLESGRNTIFLQTAAWSPGVYYLHITKDSGSSVSVFSVLK
jgi:hypothetical protein